MPAGLSQRIQLNLVFRSAMMRPTPSSVSASLSLVCEAGSSQRFSSRLSRIKACGSLATPCTTLMRSYTTRRSAPITRSRLRKPTSKSMRTTFKPVCASAAPRAAVEVVLPTPPLPDVTTMTLPIWSLRICVNPTLCRFNAASIHGRHHQDFAVEPSLNETPAQGGVEVLRRAVEAVDRQQLRLDLAAEDARLPVARHAGHGAAPQGAVDVDRAAGDDLGAGADGAEDAHVAIGKEHRLSGAHRRLQQERARLLARCGRGRLAGGGGIDGLYGRRPAALQQRREARSQLVGFDALNPHDSDV